MNDAPPSHDAAKPPLPGDPVQGCMADRPDDPALPGPILAANDPVLADKTVAAVMDGASVLVTAHDGTTAFLAAVALRLAPTRTRVLHLRPPLGIAGFMDQVAANCAPGDTQLERGFNALTMPDAGCDRIALLVEDAHGMPQATLRCIEFTLQAGPHLRVVLAGRSGIEDTLALAGFAGLRKRFPLHLALPAAEPQPAETLLPAQALPLAETLPVEALPVEASPVPPHPAATSPVPYKMSPPRLLACAAAAAGLALLSGASLVLPVPLAGAVATSGSSPTPFPGASEPVIAQTMADTASQPPFPSPGAAAAGTGSGLEADLLPGSRLAPAVEAATPSTSQAVPAEIAAVPGALSGPVPASTPELSRAVPPHELQAASNPAAIPGILNQADTLEPDPLPVPAPVTAAALMSGDPAIPSPAEQPPPEPSFAPPARVGDLPALLARPRPAVIRPERVVIRLPTPKQDGQRCRGIIVRLQLGEDPTDDERTYLRNGCR